jgi:hypothetical protein
VQLHGRGLAVSGATPVKLREPAPGTFVDEALSGSQSDLLFSVQLAGRPALVYVLLEHKSAVDPWVALQLLRYVVRIWERALRDEPRPAALPPVIPVVVCHSEAGWTAPKRLLDIIDPVATELPELGRLTPRFEFLVDDLSQATDDELLSRAMGLFAALAAISMRDARSQQRAVPTLRKTLALLGELWRAPDGGRAVALLLRYYFAVTEADPVEVHELVKDIHPQAEKLMATIAEQLSQRAREEGREEGRVEGQRRTVLKQLQLRFQPLPDDVPARIEAASAELLELWAERILTAERLEAVLGE